MLLTVATVPQFVHLMRTRRADDFATTFALLNLMGLLFLAARSAEIGEVAFLAVNLVSATFWGALLAFKFLNALVPEPAVNA